MKKLICVLLALLVCTGAACAEGAEIIRLAEGQRQSVDLNGDGTMEEIVVVMEGVEEEYLLAVYVTGADGGVCGYGTDIIRAESLCVTDLDGDHMMEIILSGDECSDDYSTYCLHYDEGALSPLLFADANRGDNEGGYFDRGYGAVLEINGRELTLIGSQDVLGTWMASRVFTLKDGRFELEDDGLWKMYDRTDDPDMWEYGSLNPVVDIDVDFNGAAGQLHPGERFMLTASDKISIVYFVTEDGRTGSFPIAPDPGEWGSLVGGVNEYECFEYLPYAD